MSGLRVYLAGPSKELDRVRAAAKQLRDAGAVITYEWWRAVEANGVGLDTSLSADAQRRHARADIDGIETADVVWALWPRGYSDGVAVEVGYAIRAKKPVIVSGASASRCIFTALTVRAHSDEEALSDEDAMSMVLGLGLRTAIAHHVDRAIIAQIEKKLLAGSSPCGEVP